MLTRMRQKGQITIPADIRESLNLSEDSMLSVAKVGDAILLTQRHSAFEAAASKFSKAAKREGISLQDLLDDLKKARRDA